MFFKKMNEFDMYNKFYDEKIIKSKENDIQDIVKKVELHYKNMDDNKLKYESIKLKTIINNYPFQEFLNLKAILISTFFAMISIIVAIAISTGINYMINKFARFLLLCYIGVSIYLVISAFKLVKRKCEQSFDILCLSTIEKIQKDREEKYKKERLRKKESKRKAKRTIIKIISKIVKAL